MRPLQFRAPLAAMGLACAVACAQTPEIITTLDWIEVYAGTTTPVANPNGVLEPGESALLTLGISFTPVGTNVPYHTPVPGGTAPIAGFAGMSFSLHAHDAGPGSWSYAGGRWGGGLGFLANHGIWLSIVSQSAPPPGALPDPANPVPDLWKALWTPDSYHARNVRFDLSIGIDPLPHLWVIYGTDPTTGNPLLGLADAHPTNDWVTIPTIPAPGPVALLTILTLAAARRPHRRGSPPHHRTPAT